MRDDSSSFLLLSRLTTTLPSHSHLLHTRQRSAHMPPLVRLSSLAESLVLLSSPPSSLTSLPPHVEFTEPTEFALPASVPSLASLLRVLHRTSGGLAVCHSLATESSTPPLASPTYVEHTATRCASFKDPTNRARPLLSLRSKCASDVDVMAVLVRSSNPRSIGHDHLLA